MTIQDQIPTLTASIDQGKPRPSAWATVYSPDPAQLGRCHQWPTPMRPLGQAPASGCR